MQKSALELEEIVSFILKIAVLMFFVLYFINSNRANSALYSHNLCNYIKYTCIHKNTYPHIDIFIY